MVNSGLSNRLVNEELPG